MKHLFIILSTIMVFPALANIDASNDSPTCDESVLNASNGTANLEINWEPNVIPLRWYSGNTEIHPENTNANSCTYDGALNIPATPPEREGYNFAGWRVRPTMEFSTLTSLPNGNRRWSKGVLNNADYCRYAFGGGGSSRASCTSDNEFKELERWEWKAEFSTGMLYGSAYCSARPGDNSNGTYPTNDSANWLALYDELESASGEKKYCWCQATGWKPNTNNPENTIYGPSSASVSSVWVFLKNNSSCYQMCTDWCLNVALPNPGFRRALVSMQ